MELLGVRVGMVGVGCMCGCVWGCGMCGYGEGFVGQCWMSVWVHVGDVGICVDVFTCGMCVGVWGVGMVRDGAVAEVDCVCVGMMECGDGGGGMCGCMCGV